MKASVEARCIVCQLVYCCADCRRRHEQNTHGLTYECPICRGFPFLCRPEQLNQDFIEHLVKEHTPLLCKKCNKIFNNMDDFSNVEKCTSISELVGKDAEIGSSLLKEVDEKFDSLYDKINNNESENVEGIISVNKNSKTAVITPIVRKKHLVDYESSDSEDGDKVGIATPHPKLVSKTPKLKRQRAATPHAKKLLGLMRQKVVEEYEETIGDDNYDGSPINKTTPSRTDNINIVLNPQKQMTTPTSHLPHLMKLAQAVTTSTPTHPAGIGWPLFPDQGADSPLSEIENTESPAQSINIEPSKTEHDTVPPKLKSIITTGSKLRIGSQDSSEKHVTFQDSNEVSMKKRVKFADDTVFEQTKAKRVFRKPKRMLTPGPQKPRFCYNPRFQALINRFENQGLIMARTPTTRDKNAINQDSTPPVGEPSNMPARAINFKDDSPIIESENTKESNELFKTCIDTPETTAISVLTTNIVGGLQNCLSSVLMNTEEETEIQFKFVITKKKVCVKRIMEECEVLDEKSSVIERNQESNKENIWSSVARAVRNVFWGEHDANFSSTTPHRSFSFDSTSSSSKRKCDEMSDTESPLNHKRHKYEGRIRGRPPLRRSKTCVSSLRSTMSAEQKSLINELSMNQDEAMNLSF
ncbi:female sterile (1) Young arrest [Anticarsia gemmatalis]|uniref:female sterile (1) Young arrest n=1 Tax=Anticarsia gemmatalis TaxID=129554 RepID=UPI003F763AF5